MRCAAAGREEERTPQHEAAHRLADRLGVPVARTAGTHMPYLDHPGELAEAMRPFLREVSGLSG
jgi:pimeloyl-ACP methyl ester carboxylesterase